MKVTVKANAKLNLTLDIVGKRDDDYHLLESVMQSVDLFDTVTVRTDNSGKISVDTSDDNIPDDESNVAYRAAEVFFRQTGKKNCGVDIRIKKRIPVGAGMAGGSADAAAVIIALNELFGTRLDEDELCDIGEMVGADVPFCLTGGTMMTRGTGNILEPLPNLAPCTIVIAKPDCSVSTSQAYRAVDEYTGTIVHPNNEDIAEDICAEDIPAVSKRLCNIFEEILAIPEVKRLKETMLERGALGAAMTGSGSAVFGIFEDEDEAESCADELRREFECEVFVTEPAAFGCEIDD